MRNSKLLFGFLFCIVLVSGMGGQAVYAQGGVDCGDNMSFEDGNLSQWDGCHYDGTPDCPIGQEFQGNCPAICNSTSSSNGVCTCNGCSPQPPCCPIKCDQMELQPGINSVNAPLGTCGTDAPGPNNSRHTITTGNGTDPNSDGNIPVVAPGGGNFSVRIGNQESGYQAECLTRTFTVTPQNVLFTYMYAVVFMDPPGHTDENRPRFEISVRDQNGDLVACGGEYSDRADRTVPT